MHVNVDVDVDVIVHVHVVGRCGCSSRVSQPSRAECVILGTTIKDIQISKLLALSGLVKPYCRKATTRSTLDPVRSETLPGRSQDSKKEDPMESFEKLGLFYLGKLVSPESGTLQNEYFLYDAKDLV
jgi:hypothetical protein